MQSNQIQAPTRTLLQQNGRRRPNRRGSSEGPPLRAPEKTVAHGAHLWTEGHEAILEVLHNNAHIFAWGPGDIPGVARETIEHCLAIKSETPAKKQKLHCMTPLLVSISPTPPFFLVSGNYCRLTSLLVAPATF